MAKKDYYDVSGVVKSAADLGIKNPILDIEEYANKYLDSKDNLQYKNSPLCIFFSALHGSGKSTLSEKLAEELNAVIINHDGIKLEVEKKGISLEESNPYMRPILHRIWEKLLNDYPNKLIIVDLGLDRWINDKESLFVACQDRKIPFFTIRLEVSKEEAERRVKNRNRGDKDRTISQAEEVYEAFMKVPDNVKLDFVYRNDQDFDNLLSVIKSRLGKK